MGSEEDGLPPLKASETGPSRMKAFRNFFKPKKPHFNFLVAHYIWIVSMTILASILIFSTAGGKLAYVDALFFASGANTQAGLNTVDVNLLNTFQQTVLYLCAMTSNPITIHTSVVFLRLYWFEKKFQNLVRDARMKRTTTAATRSKSKAKNDLDMAEQGGVNGRDITVVMGKTHKITNDGIVLEEPMEEKRQEEEMMMANEPPGSSDTDESTVKATQVSQTTAFSDDSTIKPSQNSTANGSPQAGSGEIHDSTDVKIQNQGPSIIKFAPTVKRSDGGQEQQTKFEKKTAEDHLAILERQRNDDDEVLRIPNPREAERGIGPQRVGEVATAADADDEDEGLEIKIKGSSRRAALQASPSAGHITIQEPETKVKDMPPEPTPVRPVQPPRKGSGLRLPHRRRRDDVYDEARAIGNTFTPLSFRLPRILGGKDEKVHHSLRAHPSRTLTFMDVKNALSRSGDKAKNDMPYLSWTPTEMGRNSQFPGLTLEQREELGGIEYRSLRSLALLLVCYFWGWEIFALTCLMPYIHKDRSHGIIVEEAGVTRTWWGFFTSNSAFMDLGFTLTPNSMISFQDAPWVLLVMSFLIIIGNSGFPVMLRFCIWCMSKIVPKGSGFWEELRFLLDHPRRCFTLLFPSGATWWLFWILIALNGIDVILFIILDLHAKVLAHLNVGERLVNGIFIAASTRTAGFSSVDLSQLHPAVQTSYMIMMYISVFPIAMSIRRTNVYEEKSLGIAQDESGETQEQLNDNSAMSHLGSHMRRQLSFDLWFLFICLFLLGITEGEKIMNNEFNMFAVLFECVSAYGTVGLSLGYTGVNASLCSQFSTLGKLIIIGMQIRGRHRGLPYGLDRAILLPSESRFKKEAEEAQPVLSRTNTAYSTGNAPLSRFRSTGTHLTRKETGVSSIRRRATTLSDGLARTGSGLGRHVAGMLMPGPPLPPRQKASRTIERRTIDDRRTMDDRQTIDEDIHKEDYAGEIPRRVMSGAGPSNSFYTGPT